MSDATLVLEAIHVAYGHGQQQHHVLNGFSLTVNAGELTCLLGASGSGKTTVLRAIAGFEPLSAGRIQVAGTCVAGPGMHLPPEKRHVGMVFQEYALFPHLTAAKNIAFGLRKQPNPVIQSRVRELLELIGLSALSDRYPHELSGGQQQRIALARALAPQPNILLLDEPFSSLDAETRQRLGQDVRDILKASGQTALMVTHSEQEAAMISDRIGYMQAGTYREAPASASRVEKRM